MQKKHSLKTDDTSRSKKKPATPFSTSWTNSRPSANIGSASSPGGKLSPKKLAGVGK